MYRRRAYQKRHRTLISCTECHRRKQKCNRVQPCQHCLKRSKPELCRYENHHDDGQFIDVEASVASVTGSDETRAESSTISAPFPPPEPESTLSSKDYENLVDALGYSAHGEHNTFSLVKKLESSSAFNSNARPSCKIKATDQNNRYRSLVRQLPSMEHVEVLVQQFFQDINWQYDVVDEITFRQQLANWRCIPYSVYNDAMGVLPADVLALPSLLFQLIAHSLIHQPESDESCRGLESLKYASNMTFVDLACDFSEAGSAILDTIGREAISVVAVQSGILRASLLKNTGKVIEAWRTVGTAIRDAQEIGLDATLDNPSAGIDAQWDEAMKHRIWFVLHNWDIHMAVVLGRPIMTTMATWRSTGLPDDLARRDMDESPRRRSWHDPPTPFSLIRTGYDVAYRHFPQIHALGNHSPVRKDYDIVIITRAAIEDSMDGMPLWCRAENPDTKFDQNPRCHWLPAGRQALTSGIHFVLLSLHRPYIFSMAEARAEALKAAMKIFKAQRELYGLSEPQQYISFNMVYPLFDAMVISLAIVELFPNEAPDLISELILNLQWGAEILKVIGRQNSMAKSASEVVQKLLMRLKRPGASTTQSFSPPFEHGVEMLGSCTVSADDTRHLMNESASSETSSLESIWPPHPVHDLYFQDIQTSDSHDIHLDPELLLENAEFDGMYPDNSFWSFINDFSR